MQGVGNLLLLKDSWGTRETQSAQLVLWFYPTAYIQSMFVTFVTDQSRTELNRLFSKKHLLALSAFCCPWLLWTDKWLRYVMKFHLCSSMKVVDVLGATQRHLYAGFVYFSDSSEVLLWQFPRQIFWLLLRRIYFQLVHTDAGLLGSCIQWTS